MIGSILLGLALIGLVAMGFGAFCLAWVLL
jgi:hypothetical protein